MPFSTKQKTSLNDDLDLLLDVLCRGWGFAVAGEQRTDPVRRIVIRIDTFGVIPAQAGIHGSAKKHAAEQNDRWVPAFAGTTLRTGQDFRRLVLHATESRPAERKAMLDRTHALPVTKQAAALNVSRSSVYSTYRSGKTVQTTGTTSALWNRSDRIWG